MPADDFCCPICGRAVEKDQKDFPFCGERCRLVDLGGWLDEKYRVSRPLFPGAADAPATDDEEGDVPPDPIPTDE